MYTTINDKEKKYLKNVIEKYSDKEITKLDMLRSLDKKAKKGASIFAYVFGVISSLVLGMGMSIAMKVIFAEYMIIGIMIGLIGLLFVSINYFIYKKLLKKGKNKYAKQILELSNELLNK